MAVQRRPPSPGDIYSGKGGAGGRKRGLGRFLEGFAQGFLPMWQYQKEEGRAERRLSLSEEEAERQRRRDVMSDASSQGASLAENWATDPQFEAKVQSLAALHPEIPIEDIRSSVMSDKPSLAQRRSAAYAATGAFADPSTYVSTATGDYGMPEHLFRSLPGKVPTAAQPAPYLDPNLGLLADQQTEYPFKATPAGDITRAFADAPGTFEGSREGQLYSDLQAGRQGALEREFKARAGWERDAAALLQRQEAGISEELADLYHPAALERLVTEFNRLSPLQNQQKLEQYKAELDARFKDDKDRAKNPEYQQALYDNALRTHLITNEPELFPTLDPKTNTVSWQVFNRINDPKDPRFGQSVIQTPEEAYGPDMASNFEGEIPYSQYLFESMNDPWTKMILSNFTAGELADTAAVGARLADEHPEQIASAEEGIALVNRALQSQTGPVPTGDGGSAAEIERQLAGTTDPPLSPTFAPKTSLGPDGSVRYDIDPSLGAAALAGDPLGVGGFSAAFGTGGGEVSSLSPQQAQQFYGGEADRRIAMATEALNRHQAVIASLRANEGNAPEEVVREFLKEALAEEGILADMVRVANEHRREVSEHFGGQAPRIR